MNSLWTRAPSSNRESGINIFGLGDGAEELGGIAELSKVLLVEALRSSTQDFEGAEAKNVNSVLGVECGNSTLIARVVMIDCGIGSKPEEEGREEKGRFLRLEGINGRRSRGGGLGSSYSTISGSCCGNGYCRIGIRVYFNSETLGFQDLKNQRVNYTGVDIC